MARQRDANSKSRMFTSRRLLNVILTWYGYRSMVCDFFHPAVGGVENHIYMLGVNLMRLGHKVSGCGTVVPIESSAESLGDRSDTFPSAQPCRYPLGGSRSQNLLYSTGNNRFQRDAA